MSNLLIVNLFGLKIFGELAYLGAFSGMMSLVFLVLPSNYSIIKYQEDKNFKTILSSFYIIASFLLLILSFFLHNLFSLPLWLFFLFALSNGFQSYFDISLQAENKLKNYYQVLFTMAILKILLLSVYFYLPNSQNFYELILILTIPKLSVLLFLILGRQKLFVKAFFKFRAVVELIYNKRKLFVQYYMSVGLDRINANLIIFLFTPLLGRELIAIYSLLMKVHQFIVGLIRILESLFINKKSNKLYMDSFYKNHFWISLVAQIAYIAIGLFYMKYLTQEYYFYYLIGMSISIYFYLFFIKSRAFFLIHYKNKQIIIGYFLYFILCMTFYTVIHLTHFQASLALICGLFISAQIIQMSYLVLAEKRVVKLQAH